MSRSHVQRNSSHKRVVHGNISNIHHPQNPQQHKHHHQQPKRPSIHRQRQRQNAHAPIAVEKTHSHSYSQPSVNRNIPSTKSQSKSQLQSHDHDHNHHDNHGHSRSNSNPSKSINVENININRKANSSKSNHQLEDREIRDIDSNYNVSNVSPLEVESQNYHRDNNYNYGHQRSLSNRSVSTVSMNKNRAARDYYSHHRRQSSRLSTMSTNSRLSQVSSIEVHTTDYNWRQSRACIACIVIVSLLLSIICLYFTTQGIIIEDIEIKHYDSELVLKGRISYGWYDYTILSRSDNSNKVDNVNDETEESILDEMKILLKNAIDKEYDYHDTFDIYGVCSLWNVIFQLFAVFWIYTSNCHCRGRTRQERERNEAKGKNHKNHKNRQNGKNGKNKDKKGKNSKNSQKNENKRDSIHSTSHRRSYSMSARRSSGGIDIDAIMAIRNQSDACIKDECSMFKICGIDTMKIKQYYVILFGLIFGAFYTVITLIQLLLKSTWSHVGESYVTLLDSDLVRNLETSHQSWDVSYGWYFLLGNAVMLLFAVFIVYSMSVDERVEL